MSCLVHLPYGHVLDACYEALRGNTLQFKYVMTKTAANWAFQGQARVSKSAQAIEVDLPEFRTNDLTEDPSLSVVAPAYVRDQQGADFIARMLRSLDRQSVAPDHIIVVDDGSPHPYGLDPNRHRHIRLDRNGGPAAARNVGKAEAVRLGSDIIAFIDTDCIARDDWLARIRESFISDAHASVLSGRTLSYNRGWLGEYHDLDGTLNGRRFRDTDFLLYGTTANLAITAEVARAHDFCEHYPDAAAEDIDFCFRVLSNGFGIRHVSEMVVEHDYGYNGSTFSNLVRFLRQFRRYGRGERVLLAQVPDYYAYHDESVSIRNRDIGF